MSYQPKSFNKFLATAATATLVAGAVAPAALAAGFTDVAPRYAEAVDFVASKGINGFTETQFGTSENIKRVDAAVMIAKVLELDIEAAPASGFTDVPARAVKYINAIKAAGITNGKTATSFDANSQITRGELAIWIQKGFELKGEGELTFTDVNDRYAEAVKALVSNEITNGTSATQFGVSQPAKRGDYAIFLYRAANVEAAPEVVEISSVNPVNAKTITVQFSQALDAKAFSQSAVSLVAGTGALNPGSVAQELSADGKTLTLKAADFFKGEYTLRVPFEGLKTVSGKYIKPVNQKFTVNDTAAPVVLSADTTVKAATEKITSLTLTFDEEVSAIENVKIDGNNHTAVHSGNTATISNLDLDASKSYEVTVINAKDAAGNVKEVQSAPVTVSVDNEAPSITKVEAAGENTVKVTVDEELASELAISGKIGTFTANVVSDVEVNPENSKEYIVTLNSAYLFKNGSSDTVTFTVAKDALADAIGNTNAAEITKTVRVSKDAEAPAVEKVETIATAGKVTGFTVTYNEEVASLQTSKIAVVSSKGEILPFASIATAEVSGNQVVFKLIPGVTADQYGFDFAEGFVTDKALTPNKAAANAFTVDVTDAEAPVETAFTITGATAENNVITVDFGAKVKATGTGSALKASAYQVNGATLPADTEIAFVKDENGNTVQSQVSIKLPAGFIKATDEKAVFRVSGVQTLDHKENNSFIEAVEVTDNTAPEAEAFVATELNELTVTYSEALAALGQTADVKDEVKLYDSKNAAVAIKSAKVENSKLVLTLEENAAAAVSTLTTAAATAELADLKDAAGNAQKAAVTVAK
ncbi:hypothetical protein D0469_15960 [Peribacillus saganii]|uniref:SLH domain-containing protein n=1 Tax=Peribacillus saganii TaxID=2303992 RepID=A0A372LKF9_9BACI|nr:S-layer homology domain-containing protein [Peribacillus saganii]RFU67113.1 hypothetical protein D0469_15960 [Peribacillus saganii]